MSSSNRNDIDNHKIFAILAYILFFIPLIAAKNSKFAMYHANQGLILFLAALAVNVIGTFIPILGWFLILPLGNLAVAILLILGIVTAAKGECRPLPFIGDFKILQ